MTKTVHSAHTFRKDSESLLFNKLLSHTEYARVIVFCIMPHDTEYIAT